MWPEMTRHPPWSHSQVECHVCCQGWSWRGMRGPISTWKPLSGIGKRLNMWAGGVLVQCTYNGGNMWGMKWTCAACTHQWFGLSGDDEAARMIANSNIVVFLRHPPVNSKMKLIVLLVVLWSRVRSGLIQILDMKVGDEFRSVIKLGSQQPRSFFISPFISWPAHQVEQLAVVSSSINFWVKDIGDFILQFSVNFDRRRRRLYVIGGWVGNRWFQLWYMEDRMYRLHHVQKSQSERNSSSLSDDFIWP